MLRWTGLVPGTEVCMSVKNCLGDFTHWYKPGTEMCMSMRDCLRELAKHLERIKQISKISSLLRMRAASISSQGVHRQSCDPRIAPSVLFGLLFCGALPALPAFPRVYLFSRLRPWPRPWVLASLLGFSGLAPVPPPVFSVLPWPSASWRVTVNCKPCCSGKLSGMVGCQRQ